MSYINPNLLWIAEKKCSKNKKNTMMKKKHANFRYKSGRFYPPIYDPPFLLWSPRTNSKNDGTHNRKSNNLVFICHSHSSSFFGGSQI